jgi:geranylgeranyl diphosphate synthase, type III
MSDCLRGMLFSQRKHSSQRDELSREAKSWILSEMRAAGSLEYVAGVLQTMHDSMMTTLEEVEAELGPNRRMKILVLDLK